MSGDLPAQAGPYPRLLGETSRSGALVGLSTLAFHALQPCVKVLRPFLDMLTHVLRLAPELVIASKVCLPLALEGLVESVGGERPDDGLVGRSLAPEVLEKFAVGGNLEMNISA